MPNTIILSLVGDQTIPNVLFIKALPEAREYWFIETDKTREALRMDSIAEACGITEKDIKTTLVQPETLSFVPPENWGISPEDTLYINLTGGTKMMALSVYRYYENRPNVKFYYSPIGRRESLPMDSKEARLELPTLNLHHYLLAQGYLALPPTPLSAPYSRSKALFEKVLNAKKPGDVPEIGSACAKDYKKKDKNYLTGTWFEDYLFSLIQSELNLPASQIIRGLKLQHIISKAQSESDQEVDVAFMYKETLYLVECKVYPFKADVQKLSDPVYKLGAINRTLGSGAKAIACILCPEQIPDDTLNRLDYLRKVTNVHAVLTVEDFRKQQSVKALFNLK